MIGYLENGTLSIASCGCKGFLARGGENRRNWMLPIFFLPIPTEILQEKKCRKFQVLSPSHKLCGKGLNSQKEGDPMGKGKEVMWLEHLIC